MSITGSSVFFDLFFDGERMSSLNSFAKSIPAKITDMIRMIMCSILEPVFFSTIVFQSLFVT